MTLWMFRLSRLFIPRLPESWLGPLAWIAGWIAYVVAARGRRTIWFNLGRVLGPKASTRQVHRTARRLFQYAVLHYCQIIRLPISNVDDINRRTRLVGWEHAEAALKKGKGIIWVSAHYGNPDVIISGVLVPRGIKSVVPMERLSPPELLDLMVKMRTSQGIDMIPLGGTVDRLIAALERNETVAIMNDRDIGNRGVPVTFFGYPASLPGGVNFLVRRTGATPLIGLGWGEGRDFAAEITPISGWRITDDEEADARHNTQLIATALERYIRERPEQWIMFARAWKR